MSGKVARKLRQTKKEMISDLIHSKTFEQSSFKARIGLIRDKLKTAKEKDILKHLSNSELKIK